MVLGVGKGVLFREVSSVQECPRREREVHCEMRQLTTEGREIIGTCVGDQSSQNFPPIVKATHANQLGPVTIHYSRH